MNRTEALKRLRALTGALRERGATSLYLFGSTSRNEASRTSDLDLFLDYDPRSKFSAFDLVAAKRLLEDGLRVDVDLTTRSGLHPLIRKKIEAEAVRIFNCGFCRRAAEDKYALMADDPEIRVVLKELPILGPQSLEAAQVAVAVRMQDDANGRIYTAFNKAMFQRGPANRAAALDAAKNAGADMTRLERDMTSDEIKATLDESMRLARALGISGTPSYVIGDRMIPGAVGLAALREQVQFVKASAPK